MILLQALAVLGRLDQDLLATMPQFPPPQTPLEVRLVGLAPRVPPPVALVQAVALAVPQEALVPLVRADLALLAWGALGLQAQPAAFPWEVEEGQL